MAKRIRVARVKPRTRTRTAAQKALPVRSVTIRALDPIRRCGPATSVEQLYRVDERIDGDHIATHLVFFDRHGWYCEHGRSCPAVNDVRKSSARARR